MAHKLKGHVCSRVSVQTFVHNLLEEPFVHISQPSA
jgi:hypothetical protein